MHKIILDHFQWMETKCVCVRLSEFRVLSFFSYFRQQKRKTLFSSCRRSSVQIDPLNGEQLCVLRFIQFGLIKPVHIFAFAGGFFPDCSLFDSHECANYSLIAIKLTTFCIYAQARTCQVNSLSDAKMWNEF